MTILPENILTKLSAKDRKAIGQQSAAEAQGKYEAGQEKILQRDIGNFLMHVPNTYFFRQPMNKRAQGRVGCADFLVLHRGRWISVEAKTSTGKQRAEQHLDEIAVNNAGGIYVLARSVADVQAALRRVDAEINICREALAKTGWTAKP